MPYILLPLRIGAFTGISCGVAVTRRRPERLQLVGSGSGAAVLQAGWVYQSMADEDPLADILPNGAYALWTAADLQVRHIFTATDGTIIEQRSPGEVPPQQMLNAIGTHLPVFFWNGQTPVPATIDTTGLRRLMENSLAVAEQKIAEDLFEQYRCEKFLS